MTDADPLDRVSTDGMAVAATLNGGPDFEVALVPDVGALGLVRREVGRRLGEHGVHPDTINDALLVVCELCTNAIQATEPRDAPVLVRVRLGDAAIAVEVENVGPPFDALARIAIGTSEADTEGGRGLAIVLALSRDVSVHFHDGQCTVTAIIAQG